MPEALIHLDIITPTKVYFSDDVKSFTAPGVEGSFQILSRHAPFVSTIAIGKMKFVTKDGETMWYVTSGGTVDVIDNKITMLAETVESKEEINLRRAEEAKQRAERRLASKEPGVDIERAKIALFRALNRIRFAGSGD